MANILIIDDNRSFCDLLTHAISSVGHTSAFVREHSLFLKMSICSIRIPLSDNNLNSLDIFMSLDYGNVGTQAQRRDIWGCLLFPRSRRIMQGRGGIGGLSTYSS
jgi:hypothetical protein